jgi:hypothetical protein
MTDPGQDSPLERDRKATELIEARVRREAEIDNRFYDLDRWRVTVNGSIERTGSELRGVKGEVTKLREAVERREAISTALADSARALADKQVTFRQLVFSLLAAVTGLGLLMVGFLSLTGHG